VTSPDDHYRVQFSQQAKIHARRLRRQSAIHNLAPDVDVAIRAAYLALVRDPYAFGDPLYETKHPKGYVRHGVRAPLLFRFVIYKSHRYVWVYEIVALTHSLRDQQ
jgi:hypothetical protein